MNASSPHAVLDESTVQELQPVCDAGRTVCFCPACRGTVTNLHSCAHPARWVIRVPCRSGCDLGQVIACTPHKEQLMSDPAGRCPKCRRICEYVAEPL